MPVIMICDARPAREDADRLAEALHRSGYGVETFSDGVRFLEAAVARPPDLVVYGLGAQLDEDLGVLRLLRRAQPDVNLIVIADQPTLRTRMAVQPLRPVFCSVEPSNTDEVLEVVRTTLKRRARPG